jgi:hypothetical protein
MGYHVQTKKRDIYLKTKDVFIAKREKIPRPISGLSGIYSLKRLAESWMK